MELTGTHLSIIDSLAKGDLFIPVGLAKYEGGLWEVKEMFSHESDSDTVWIDYIRVDGVHEGAPFARGEIIFVDGEMDF